MWVAQTGLLEEEVTVVNHLPLGEELVDEAGVTKADDKVAEVVIPSFA